jgi:exodeoxyribonuclease VIII
MSELINKITDEQYEALDGINFSKLKPFLNSPYLFKKSIENPMDDDNVALKIGVAVHCLALTPEIFGEKFAVSVTCDRRTKEGKAAWEAFTAENAGKTVLSPQEFDVVANCFKAISSNNFFKHVFDFQDEIYLEAGGSTEIFGSKVKGRVDLFNKSKNLIVDIKTCSEIPNVDNIRKAIWKHKYYMQAFIYKAIVDNAFKTNAEFVFLFVDKKNFNSVGLAKVGSEFLNRAAMTLNETLCRYENCKANNIWPSLPNSDFPYIVDAFKEDFEDAVDILLEDDDNA